MIPAPCHSLLSSDAWIPMPTPISSCLFLPLFPARAGIHGKIWQLNPATYTKGLGCSQCTIHGSLRHSPKRTESFPLLGRHVANENGLFNDTTEMNGTFAGSKKQKSENKSLYVDILLVSASVPFVTPRTLLPIIVTQNSAGLRRSQFGNLQQSLYGIETDDQICLSDLV